MTEKENRQQRRRRERKQWKQGPDQVKPADTVVSVKEIGELFATARDAVENSPESTQRDLKAEIATQGSTDYPLVAASASLSAIRILRAFGSIPPELVKPDDPFIKALVDATKGAVNILTMIKTATNTSDVLGAAEFESVVDEWRQVDDQTSWDLIYEMREKLKIHPSGFPLADDIAHEVIEPGSKFKNPLFEGNQNNMFKAGVISGLLLFKTHYFIGADAQLGPEPLLFRNRTDNQPLS